MLDKNDLQAIAELLKPINNWLDSMDERLDSMDERLDSMDERLDSMDKRLDSIDERLSNVEEDTKITRSAVNTILEWAEDASIQEVPLFKKAK